MLRREVNPNVESPAVNGRPAQPLLNIRCGLRFPPVIDLERAESKRPPRRCISGRRAAPSARRRLDQHSVSTKTQETGSKRVGLERREVGVANRNRPYLRCNADSPRRGSRELFGGL